MIERSAVSGQSLTFCLLPSAFIPHPFACHLLDYFSDEYDGDCIKPTVRSPSLYSTPFTRYPLKSDELSLLQSGAR
ncbi:MAG: hypothetical protein KME45_22280 [Stenomitos rutilans HA7619-LM2]|nr:hypothetical protein [Stenomitos rutilans HA7619-LM2]